MTVADIKAAVDRVKELCDTLVSQAIDERTADVRAARNGLGNPGPSQKEVNALLWNYVNAREADYRTCKALCASGDPDARSLRREHFTRRVIAAALACDQYKVQRAPAWKQMQADFQGVAPDDDGGRHA